MSMRLRIFYRGLACLTLALLFSGCASVQFSTPGGAVTIGSMQTLESGDAVTASQKAGVSTDHAVIGSARAGQDLSQS